MVEQEHVAIFWDFENCSPPSSGPGYDITNNIREIAHRFGIVKVFKAYLDSAQSTRSSSLRSELQSCGVSLTDCPHNGRKDVADKMMLVDMLTYAIDTPSPATLILITGDRDFVYAVSVLRLRKYRIVVVAPNATHISLRMQASEVLDWNTDVLGKSAVEASSTLASPNLLTPSSTIAAHRRTQSTNNALSPTTPAGQRGARRSFGKAMAGLNPSSTHSAPQSAPRTPMGQSTPLRSPLTIVKQMEELDESALEEDESPVLDINDHIRKFNANSESKPMAGQATATAPHSEAASAGQLEPLSLGGTLAPAFEAHSTPSGSINTALNDLGGDVDSSKEPSLPISPTPASPIMPAVSQPRRNESSDAPSLAGSTSSFKPQWTITTSKLSSAALSQEIKVAKKCDADAFNSKTAHDNQRSGATSKALAQASAAVSSAQDTLVSVGQVSYNSPSCDQAGPPASSRPAPTLGVNVIIDHNAEQSTGVLSPPSPAEVAALFRAPLPPSAPVHPAHKAPMIFGEGLKSPPAARPSLGNIVAVTSSSASSASQPAPTAKAPVQSSAFFAPSRPPLSSLVAGPTVASSAKISVASGSQASPQPVQHLKSPGPAQTSLSWVSAAPTSLPTSRPSLSDAGPPTKPIPKGYDILLTVLEQFRKEGQIQPTRHHVSDALKKADPQVYTKAGHTKFKQYSTFAEAYGLVELGGDQDKAWMRLLPEWYDRAQDV